MMKSARFVPFNTNLGHFRPNLPSLPLDNYFSFNYLINVMQRQLPSPGSPTMFLLTLYLLDSPTLFEQKLNNHSSHYSFKPSIVIGLSKCYVVSRTINKLLENIFISGIFLMKRVLKVISMI